MTNKVKYTPQSYPVIAVDFDGTLVKDQFPNLGQPFIEGINTVNAMIEAGYEIVIWTARQELVPVMEHLKNHGLNIDKVKINAHADYMLNRYESQGIKIGASIYIDDRGYGAPIFNDSEWLKIKSEFC